MENETPSANQSFLLASALKPLSFIKYQLVFQISDNIRYLKSFNILTEKGAIINKYYLKSPLHFDEKVNIEQIICELLFPETGNSNDTSWKNKKTKKRKNRIDQQAKHDAVNYLFNELGL